MIVYTSCPGCGDRHIARVLAAKDFTVSMEEFEIWGCNNCTLRFTQNIPGPEDIGKYYRSENYISHSDTSEGLINHLYHKVRKRTLIQKRDLIRKATGKKEGTILDVGAGTGAFLDTMQKSHWHCTGIEPDHSAREKALSLYGLHLKEAAEIYRLNTGAFDAVTLWHVLEHVHELHPYVEQLKNLLSPQGRILIAVPNYTSPDSKMYREFWAAYDVPRHLYHFSPKAMQRLLETHGLSIHSIKPMWFDSIYVSMLSEQYKTGKPQPVKALIRGMVSNMATVFDHKKCSSLIYIASRK